MNIMNTKQIEERKKIQNNNENCFGEGEHRVLFL